MSTNPLDELVRLSEEMGGYDMDRCPQCNRRVPSATPDVREWIERVKDRALAHVPPGVIDDVVKSWELYRRTMEEGP